MQQRCSGLPQTPGHGLALRIGIHQGALRQRAEDEDDGAREIAAKLALIDADIVTSNAVVAELNDDLRQLANALADGTSEPAACRRLAQRTTVDRLRQEAQGSISASANGPYLVLWQGLKTLELTQDYPVLTVGRAPSMTWW